MSSVLKAALGALVLALLAIPAVVGRVAQPQLTQWTERLAAHGAPGVEVLSADSATHWFGSRAHLVVDVRHPIADAAAQALALPVSDGAPLPLELELRLHHGLLPLASPERGGVLPALASATVDVYHGHGTARRRLPVDITVRQGFNETVVTARSHLVTPDGDALVHVDGTLARGAGTDLAALLGRADGNAGFAIPAAVLEALMASRDYGHDDLRFLRESGYLRREGDHYTSEITLRDGRLTVNGHAVPLPY